MALAALRKVTHCFNFYYIPVHAGNRTHKFPQLVHDFGVDEDIVMIALAGCNRCVIVRHMNSLLDLVQANVIRGWAVNKIFSAALSVGVNTSVKLLNKGNR